jgi:NAD-dependent deacetylase
MPDLRLSEKIARLRGAIARAARLCVLTGAGVSAESGVPVYRGNEGLYAAWSAADMATPEGFARNPEKVWAWYHDRRRQLAATKPNPGHLALAALQAARAARLGPDSFRLVTQNVDGLHQAAGSRDVIEVHGSLWQIRCTACAAVTDAHGPLAETVPRCPACGAICRPHIVWFGEMLPPAVWTAAVEAASACDIFLSVGTSAVVQPVASLVHLAADAGALVAEINLEETPNTRWVDLSLLGPSGEVLPALVGA